MKMIALLVASAVSCSPAQARGPSGAAAPGYDRGDWRHWTDADGDCQDTRQEVLVRQSEIPVTYEDARKCRVATGRWTCQYTGLVVTDPSLLDVDHVVSLREASDSGGSGWDPGRKEGFANDLESPELAAVTLSSNRSKGSRGPEEWMPAYSPGRCKYVRDRVSVQLKWGLSIPETEARYVLRVLVDECSR